MQQKKSSGQNDTPLSKKILMALAAVAILLGTLFILGGNPFPSEITYRKVSGNSTPYVIQRENVKRP